MVTRAIKPFYPAPSPASIKKFRSKYGITQERAAEIAMVTIRTWANWESGDRRMQPAIWAWVQHAASQA